MNNKKTKINLFEIYLIITEKKDNPSIMLRRQTTDHKIIKQLVTAALNNQPVIVHPQFTNRIKSLNSLQEKGILYYDNETNSLKWTI